jgi:hypothetical protein
MASHAAALISTALIYLARQLPLAAGSYRHDLATLFIWRHVASVDKPVGPATNVAREALDLLVASMPSQYVPMAAAVVHDVFQSEDAFQREHLVGSTPPPASTWPLLTHTHQNSSYSHVTESLKACLDRHTAHSDAAVCAPEELFSHHFATDPSFRLEHLCTKVSCMSPWSQT